MRREGPAAKEMTPDQLQARERVLKAMTGQEYAIDSLTACICDSTSFVPIASRDRHALPVSTAICTSCGLLVQTPRFTAASLETFYNSDYRALYSSPANDTPEKLFAAQMEHGVIVYARLAEVVHDFSPGSVLDVGCGAGGVLQKFKEHGWQVMGSEIDSELAAYANGRGIPVIPHPITGTAFDSQRFSLVIITDALEHVRDPLVLLSKAHRLLEPGGHVYVKVPGLRHMAERPYPELIRELQLAHLYYWDLLLLQYLFAKAGFTMVAGTDEIKAVFKKSSKSIPLPDVSGHYQTTLSFLQTSDANRVLLFLRNNIALMLRHPISFLRTARYFATHSLK